MAKSSSGSTFIRLVRGFIALGAIIVALGFFGSIFMRAKVVRVVKERTLTSGSAVMSRPYELRRKMPFAHEPFVARLTRLGYRQTNHLPDKPGFYQKGRNSFWVFTKSAQFPDGQTRPPRLVKIQLDDSSQISGIIDVKYREQISSIALEPEFLSLLGNTAERAVSPRELDEFSPHLRNAVLSIEDERFQYHFGIDPLSVLRALYVNFKSGKIVQGGSTLTQQLAKNLFLSPERTITRKLFEAFAALLIETAFTKDQILELYLNEIYLGQEGPVAIHGFGEASLAFFGTEVGKLSIAQAATLAGIIKAPSRYSPRRHPERAKKRRRVVLAKMLEREQISKTQYQKATLEVVSIKKRERARRQAPYFIDFIRKTWNTALDGSQLGPVKIHTGLDVEMQLCAERAVKSGLKAIRKNKKLRGDANKLQAALVSVSPTNGQIMSWVGGRNYQQNQFNRVSMAKRQPGSAFKPFVYLTALDSRLNDYRAARTSSILLDDPMRLKIHGSVWEPRNYDKKFRGEVTVRQALVHSLNVPTVDLALKVGIPSIAATAELFGFGKNLPRVPSLALGAGEVSPLELANAYGALANGGRLLTLRPILSITTDEEDSPLATAALRERRAASEAAVYVLTNMLQSVIEQGTGRVVRKMGFKRPAAGKTGTTNDTRDAWFAGYTPQLLAVVWVGYDNNSSTGLTGASGAAPIWTRFMRCALEMEPTLEFVPPPGVVFRKIDMSTGQKKSASCPQDLVATEVFVKGNEPITPCKRHRRRGFFEDNDDDINSPRRKAPPTEFEKSLRQFWDRLWM